MSNKKRAVSVVIKGALQTVPVAGGLLAEMYSEYMDPLRKRREAFIETLARDVEATAKKLGRITADLMKDPEFISVVGYAAQKAAYVSKREKISALKNIVLNGINQKNIDEDMCKIFLDITETFTVWHLLVLSKFPNSSSYDLSRVDQLKRDGIEIDIHFVDKIAKDFETNGLVKNHYLFRNPADADTVSKSIMLTEFGKKLKAYIARPDA
jgi:hypothetical protein